MPAAARGVLLVAAVLGSSIGCQLTPAPTAGLPGLGGSPELASAPGPGEPAVQVQVRNGAGNSTMKTIAYDPRSTVNTALDAVQASRQFADMEVLIFRRSPEGQTIRMAARYDADARRVVPEADYALRAGDRVLIKEIEVSPVSRLAAMVIGPYSKVMD